MTGVEVFPEGAPSPSAVARTLAEMSIVSRACELIPHAGLTEQFGIDELPYQLANQYHEPGAWRQTDEYKMIMADELGYLTPEAGASQKVLRAKRGIIDAAIDSIAMPAPDPQMQPEDYISGIAGYDALERVGWLTKGSLLAAVKAAYLHRQAEDLYKQSDEFDMYPDRQTVAQTNRALRSYRHRVDSIFRFAPYVELVNLMFEGKQALELNRRKDSIIGHWWTQLDKDLLTFRTRTV